jgi:hypothetical protein
LQKPNAGFRDPVSALVIRDNQAALREKADPSELL